MAAKTLPNINKSEIKTEEKDFLGRGGYGVVYCSVWEARSGRGVQKVALKVFEKRSSDEDDERAAVFKNEAAIGYGLDHQNIIKVR